MLDNFVNLYSPFGDFTYGTNVLQIYICPFEHTPKLKSLLA